MTADRFAQHHFPIVTNAKTAVILCQSFIEPSGGIAKSAIDEQVCVLVKNNGKRILFAAHFSRKGDVVDVRSRLKVTGNIRIRSKWTVGLVALKHDHRGGHWRSELRFRKQAREHFTKLLQPVCDLADIFFPGVTNELEVTRTHTYPVVFGKDRTVGRKDCYEENEGRKD